MRLCILSPRLVVRGLPLFRQGRERMGHPLLVGGSDLGAMPAHRDETAMNRAQILIVLGNLMTGPAADLELQRVLNYANRMK